MKKTKKIQNTYTSEIMMEQKKKKKMYFCLNNSDIDWISFFSLSLSLSNLQSCCLTNPNPNPNPFFSQKLPTTFSLLIELHVQLHVKIVTIVLE